MTSMESSANFRKSFIEERRRAADSLLRTRRQRFPESFTAECWENHVSIREVLATTPPAGLILDFGCGTGERDILLSKWRESRGAIAAG